MTHTSSFFASWERLGNRITPRESYPINFLLALLDGASIADIRVCVQREYISNGHRRATRVPSVPIYKDPNELVAIVLEGAPQHVQPALRFNR